MPTTKAKVDSNESVMLFGQKQEKLTVKVLRSILTSYGHKLKARELRLILLKRVITLESAVGYLDGDIISELLASKVEVTRAAIEQGREDYEDHFDEDDSELGWDDDSEYWGEQGAMYDEAEEDYDDYDDEDEEQVQGAPLVYGEKYGINAAFSGAQQDRPKEILCNVCYDKQSAENFRDTVPHAHCTLKFMPVCEACMRGSLNAQFQVNHWKQIYCPLDKHILPPEIVRQYASKEFLPKYNDFVKLMTLRDKPNFRWCSNPECSSGQVHDGGASSPHMTCKECSFVTCFTHQRPWHEGHTCEEFDEQRDPKEKKEEAASDNRVENSSAPCPSCSARVTKTSGCARVKCFCGYCFDWDAAMKK